MFRVNPFHESHSEFFEWCSTDRASYNPISHHLYGYVIAGICPLLCQLTKVPLVIVEQFADTRILHSLIPIPFRKGRDLLHKTLEGDSTLPHIGPIAQTALP